MALAWLPLETVRIPARPVGFWSLAYEYVPGVRLLRITVLQQDRKQQAMPTTWNINPNLPCGPDGNVANPDKVPLLCTTASYGALVGKIGGSTGDLPDTTPGNTSPWGSKRVFAAGTLCVLNLAITDGGPVFLTMNDEPGGFSRHSGELLVSLEYYPL